RTQLPSFNRIENAARFLRKMISAECVALPSTSTASEYISDNEQTYESLAAVGVEFPVRELFTPRDTARLAHSSAQVPEPWVVKIPTRGVAHKASTGGVFIGQYAGVGLVHRVTEALAKMETNGLEPSAIVIEEFIDARPELFFAIRMDPTFGLVLAVGLGG